MVVLWSQSRHEATNSPGSAIRSARVGGPVTVQLPIICATMVRCFASETDRGTGFMENASVCRNQLAISGRSNHQLVLFETQLQRSRYLEKWNWHLASFICVFLITVAAFYSLLAY